MKKNNIIHEFNTKIYPFKIYIVCNPNYKFINDNFAELSSNCEFSQIEKKRFDNHNGLLATTYFACHLEQRQMGVLFIIWDKKRFDVKTVTHETIHACNLIFDHLDMDKGSYFIGNDECYCYLAGYISDCLNQVRTNKFK